MFHVARPRDDRIAAFLATQRDLTSSYAEVGSTRGTPPRGYVVDHNRARLGVGKTTFDREERFTVEWHAMDDGVWYDLYALSRPGHALVRLAYPFARRLQRRFARDSKRAMMAAACFDAS
jgi:uncharacterized protein (UPF0548 family)